MSKEVIEGCEVSRSWSAFILVVLLIVRRTTERYSMNTCLTNVVKFNIGLTLLIFVCCNV
jgi:hypothetical protein